MAPSHTIIVTHHWKYGSKRFQRQSPQNQGNMIEYEVSERFWGEQVNVGSYDSTEVPNTVNHPLNLWPSQLGLVMCRNEDALGHRRGTVEWKWMEMSSKYKWLCQRTQRQCSFHQESMQQNSQCQSAHAEACQLQHESWHPIFEWSCHRIQRQCVAQ